MEVYFIRHGESEYNVLRRINQDARRKIGLTERGKNQAMEAGMGLKSKKFDLIISSNFLRTRETAKIISGVIGTEVEIDSLVREWRVGFEGQPAENYNKRAEKDVFNFKLRGKESWTDVMGRMQRFKEKLMRKNYGRVLVVTHEHVIRTTFVVFGGEKKEDVVKKNVGNCEYVRFVIYDSF